ncbi:MAG: NUDIX domain-containing protein [bacterium]
MGKEKELLQQIINKKEVRISVRSLCFHDGKLLVQRPNDDPNACYGTIGGKLELGESMEERICKEYAEETNARVISAKYLFVIENRFRYGGGLVHGIEHFFLVDLDTYEIESCVSYLAQHWLPVDRLIEYDLRPHILRDAIADGYWRQIKHLIVSFK